VSLSWRDRYIGVLSPERVALVRRRRGWNRAFDIRIDAPCGDASPAAAATALEGLLQRPEVAAGNITLLLSNHFVRYLLVPWRSETKTPEEFMAFAGICCDRLYGGDPGRRILRTARERAGRPRLAAVLEAEFLAALRRAVGASRLRLASVQPYLAAAFNCLGVAFRQDSFLFLVAEPSRTCLLVALGGCWHSVRAGSGEDSPQALADLIEREAQLLGLEPDGMPPIFVHSPRQSRLDLPECNGVAPATLALPIPAALAEGADPLLAMAMTVA